MEFSEVLARRRMVRNYTDRPVPSDKLQRVIAAGLRAPSAGNSQGQSLVVVTDAQLRKQVADLAGETEYVQAGFDPWISGAPVQIVLCVSEEIYHQRYQEADKVDSSGQEIEWPVPYWWVDAGASMMALLLAAVDEGLGAGFLGTHAMGNLAQLLRIPDTVSPVGIITLGYPAPDRRSGSLDRGKRPSEQTVHYQRWNQAE